MRLNPREQPHSQSRANHHRSPSSYFLNHTGYILTAFIQSINCFLPLRSWILAGSDWACWSLGGTEEDS